jgi:hypothetical protein
MLPLEELLEGGDVVLEEGELLLDDGVLLEDPLAPPALELPLVVPDELEEGELLLPEVEPLPPEVELAPKYSVHS